MKNQYNKANTFQQKRQKQDKVLILKPIVNQVEKGTEIILLELKNKYSEEHLFAITVKYVNTTKKVLCTAFNIPIEAGCRYKRKLEKHANLVQSLDEVIFPFTKNPVHLISINPKEFKRLLKSNNNQLKMF